MEVYKVNAVDTTGAGDSFMGAFLYFISDRHIDLNEISKDEMKAAFKFSNAAAALTTIKEGAISALPTLQSVENFMKVKSLK